MKAQSVPVAAIVLTKDEERNLGPCLVSLGPAAQVIVIDSGSTDATRELAEQSGALVIEHAWPGYAAQRNWALENPSVQHDWVLFVDADERVPEDAWEEIHAFLAAPDAAGASFRRAVVFCGRELRHGGFETARVVRLFDRKRARYVDRPVHEHPVVDGKVRRFESRLAHHDQRPFEAWLARHNEYSSLEARSRVSWRPTPEGARLAVGPRVKDTLRRRLWPKVPAKPLALFLYVYVVRAGFLDGMAGLRIAALYGFQELSIAIKAEELVKPEVGA